MAEMTGPKHEPSKASGAEDLIAQIMREMEDVIGLIRKPPRRDCASAPRQAPPEPVTRAPDAA